MENKLKIKLEDWICRKISDYDESNLKILLERNTEILKEIDSCADTERKMALIRIFSSNNLPEDEKFQKRIIELINTVKYYKQVADLIRFDRKNCFKLDEYFQLCELIGNSKGEDQAELSRFLSHNDIVLSSGNVVEVIKLTSNAEEEARAVRIGELVRDEKVRASGKALELAQLIADAKGKEQAIYGYYVACNLGVLVSGHVIELTKLVTSATREYQAECGSIVARDPDVLKSGHVIELTRIITNAIGEVQTNRGSDVARDLDVLESEHVIELTRIITNAIGEYQAECASDVARDVDVLASEHVVELTRIVTNAVGDDQADYSSDVILDKRVLTSNLMENNRIIDVATSIAQAVNSKAALYAKELLLRALDLGFENIDKIIYLVQKICSGEYLKQFEEKIYEKHLFMNELEDAYLSVDFKRVSEMLKGVNSPEEKMENLAYRLNLKKRKKN